MRKLHGTQSTDKVVELLTKILEQLQEINEHVQDLAYQQAVEESDEDLENGVEEELVHRPH